MVFHYAGGNFNNTKKISLHSGFLGLQHGKEAIL